MMPAGCHFFGAPVVIVDRAGAGFFLVVDFGFFASRLLRFCPLAMSFPISESHHRWRRDSMREGWHHVHHRTVSVRGRP